ncbi:MAG: hypothetical protein Q9178_004363 [Gyalolechia marmorata]
MVPSNVKAVAPGFPANTVNTENSKIESVSDIDNAVAGAHCPHTQIPEGDEAAKENPQDADDATSMVRVGDFGRVSYDGSSIGGDFYDLTALRNEAPVREKKEEARIREDHEAEENSSEDSD